MIKSLSILILSTLLFGLAFSQENKSIRPENVNIASPNAAALGKVADIPVGYHTGIPNVDIPIYTVSHGSLKMPISVSYHAGGLRVMEQASWVGAGWSLNAGGMITRGVRGMPDEVLSSIESTPISYLSSNGYFDYLDVDDNDTISYLDYYNFGSGKKDGEPDLFTFNFNGNSGKFYFRPDHSVVTMPLQDIHIKPLFCGTQPNCNSANEDLYGWIITTADGVRYYFGKTIGNQSDIDPIENTTSYSSNSGLTPIQTIASWYLYKIESPDGLDSINITYDHEEYSYYTISTFPVASSAGTMSGSEGIDLVKNYVYGVRLKNISTPNTTATFTAWPTARLDLSSNQKQNLTDFAPINPTDNIHAKALKSISISSPLGATACQLFEFNYDYFYDNVNNLTGYPGTQNVNNNLNIQSDKRRLKLLSITEKSCDATIIKPSHQFTYFNETAVPRTLSLAQDHWGFYNGATANPSLLPPLSVDGGLTYSSGANRESAWPAMLAGTLQKIQYPTGGATEFTFSSHLGWHKPDQLSYTSLSNVNADNNNTSSPFDFTVTSPTVYKVSISFTTGGSVPGQGIAYVKNSQNQVVQSFSSSGDYIFTLSGPEAYTFYVQSTSGSSGAAIMATLYKRNDDNPFVQVPVGGLRINTISYNDGMGNPPVNQTFSYLDDTNDTGVLFSRPTYVSLVRNDSYTQSGLAMGLSSGGAIEAKLSNGCIPLGYSGNPQNPDAPPYLLFYSASSILPMRTSQGNHVGYNRVKVTQMDGGYTVYKFTNFARPIVEVSNRSINRNVCDYYAPNFPPAPDPYVTERGELIRKSIFNSSGQLLAEEVTSNNYAYEDVGVMGLTLKAYNFGVGEIWPGTYYFPTEYELRNARKTKATIENFTYDAVQTHYTKTETFFESKYHNQPTKIVLSDAPNGGNILSETRKTYVADLLVPDCADDKLTQDNAMLIADLSSLYSAYIAQRGLCTNASCLYKAWRDYHIKEFNDRRKAYVQDRLNHIEEYNDCMSDLALDNAAISQNLKAIVRLSNRHQTASILENSHWRNGQFLGSEYLDYSNFQNNSMYIYPSQYFSIPLAAPQQPSNFSPLSATNTALVKDSKYIPDETYTYVAGNLTEVVGRSGVITSYIWGYNDSYPIVKAVGVSYAVLKSAYDAVSGNLNTLRAQGTLSGAQISTYVYDVSVGLISMTDPNSFTSYYEYDKLGRLELVRDSNNKIFKTYKYVYKDGTTSSPY